MQMLESPKKLSSLAKISLVAATVGLMPWPAFAVGPEPAPLPAPVELTVGYQKVGHLAPMILISDELKKLGSISSWSSSCVMPMRARAAGGFARRGVGGTSRSCDRLGARLDQCHRPHGVGSSPKYVIGRNGTKFESWEDLKGKKIAIAPGSAVWFQLAATLVERGVPYNSFEAVNIQGGGANFDQALKKGDVDGIVTWEPFESIP